MVDQTSSPIRTVSEPTDRLLYAVGDIHGRLDLLDRLLDHIERDAVGEPYALVFLGDYVDRGHDSAGVIERILTLHRKGGPWIGALAGNHETFVLDFLNTPAIGGAWLDYGGGATLASYGVKAPRMRTDTQAWTQAALELGGAMPTAHLNFLKALPFAYAWGDFVFAHAGVRPGAPLDLQTPMDLTCIRGSFLSAKDPAPGRVVVFGHTPMQDVWAEGGKIGVDTGAYATGVLSALRIHRNALAVVDSHGAREALDISRL